MVDGICSRPRHLDLQPRFGLKATTDLVLDTGTYVPGNARTGRLL